MNKHELDSKTDYLSDWPITQRNVILDIWTWATSNWMIDFDRFLGGDKPNITGHIVAQGQTNINQK